MLKVVVYFPLEERGGRIMLEYECQEVSEVLNKTMRRDGGNRTYSGAKGHPVEVCGAVVLAKVAVGSARRRAVAFDL
jgi:hypothetical protein